MLELAELNDEERKSIAVGRALELDEPADRDQLAALVAVVRMIRRHVAAYSCSALTAQDAATIVLRALYG